MLLRLTVENYALIEHLELELDKHLNILTGETGAGKSILLGALGLLLGNKNDGSAMKDATRNCVIEGLFDLRGLGLEEFFEQNELEYEEQITIRRIITPAGKSRSFVGDLPAQLSVVKELGSHLLDIHSQHQNLIISSEEFRIQTLDTLSACGELRSEYEQAFALMNSAKRELQRLREEAEVARRDEEWLHFQVEELSSAKLKSGELAELEQQQAFLANADKIGETLASLHNAMSDEMMGILPQLKSLSNALRAIGDNLPDAKDWAERVHSSLVDLSDIESSAVMAYERLDADPERLEKIDNRMALIYSLMQKHRAADLDELITIRDNYSAKLNAIIHSDEQIRQARESFEKRERRCKKLSAELHKSRAASIPDFERRIVETVSELGMTETIFKVELTELESLTASGGDSVSYLFTANRTTKPQPIERIASGGELSRVMLALKSLLAERMELPTILFDEIDTGVSGRIADAMGRIISRLSEKLQVVDITHLPQVASKGTSHFVVYKESGHTLVRKLEAQERVSEIAKMLSGAEVTTAAIEQAKILLDN